MLAEYLRAVLRHIYFLLVGALGAILTVVGIVAPAYVQLIGFVLLAVGLVGAQFLAWREARREHLRAVQDRAEAELRWSQREAALLAKLDVREKRKALREALGDFFSKGEEVRAVSAHGCGVRAG